MDIEKLTGDKSIEDFEKRLLSLDSEFNFKCRKCGKCCVHQNSILLNTRDIFRIAQKLGKTMTGVIDEYAEVYIAQNSNIPIVHLLPRGKKEECPFLQDKLCSIQDCKPTVCALFPLGRVFIYPKSSRDKKAEVRYVLNDIFCGSRKQRHTVREWLSRFEIPEHDEFFLLWSDTVADLGSLFHSLAEKGVNENAMSKLWNVAYFFLYINYTTDKDFMPQFQEATHQLREFAKSTRLGYGVNI